MVDEDEHTTTVLDIFRETISRSGGDDRLSILSPVLPNIVNKMTQSENNINEMLKIIDSAFDDARE
eukprot:6111270-Pleurochrysis_carterae.AAC.1